MCCLEAKPDILGGHNQFMENPMPRMTNISVAGCLVSICQSVGKPVGFLRNRVCWQRCFLWLCPGWCGLHSYIHDCLLHLEATSIHLGTLESPCLQPFPWHCPVAGSPPGHRLGDAEGAVTWAVHQRCCWGAAGDQLGRVMEQLDLPSPLTSNKLGGLWNSYEQLGSGTAGLVGGGFTMNQAILITKTRDIHVASHSFLWQWSPWTVLYGGWWVIAISNAAIDGMLRQ